MLIWGFIEANGIRAGRGVHEKSTITRIAEM
jgi:hypothetical protein